MVTLHESAFEMALLNVSTDSEVQVQDVGAFEFVIWHHFGNLNSSESLTCFG